jgi:hypothetical protein
MLATILNLAPLYGMLYPVLRMLYLLNLTSFALPIASFFFLMGDTKLFRVPPYYQYHARHSEYFLHGYQHVGTPAVVYHYGYLRGRSLTLSDFFHTDRKQMEKIY